MMYEAQQVCETALSTLVTTAQTTVPPAHKQDGNQSAKPKNTNSEDKISLGGWQTQML